MTAGLSLKASLMKVGDLVTHVTSTLMSVGLVIETGKYTGNADIKVLWNGTREAVTQRSEYRI